MTPDEELAHLREQRTALQARGTELVEENRALRAQLAGGTLSPEKRATAQANDGELCDSDLYTIGAMQSMFHARSVLHGWYDDAPHVTPDRIAARIALIHSEASEALEAVRDGTVDNAEEWASGAKPVGVASELADVVIRVFDLAEWMGIDMGRAIAAKHRFNGTRAHRHGGKRL